MANEGFFSKLFSNKKQPKKTERKYEGASKQKRLRHWYPTSTSANNEIGRDLETLRNRSRDLRRNNPLANKGINVISSNVVGHGVKTKFEGVGSERIQEAWDAWANSTDCDFNGLMDFYGLQRMVVESVIESGEVVGRKQVVSSAQMPLKVQLLESDFIATKSVNVKDGNDIVQGIEYNSQGLIESYHLYEKHPGDWATYGFRVQEQNLKINKFSPQEVYHVFKPERPGQARGVPWLSPIMIRLKDLDEFIDATIMKQKVAACFAGFVTNMNAEFLEPEDLNADYEMLEKIEPGIIEELPAGRDIKFADPPNMEGIKEFHSVSAHTIASGLGITYEALTGDLSEVNFSSARMGWIEMGRNIEAWRKNILINMFIERVVKDFLQTYSLKNNVNVSGIKWRHISPNREMIDPSREIPAKIKAIRAGLTSLSEEIAATGKDSDKILNQIAKDNEKLDGLNIVLDSDPRKITVAGIKQLDEVENNENQ